MDGNSLAEFGFKGRDLRGQIFERLTVLGLGEQRGGKWYWRCRCICGVEKLVSRTALVTGGVRSCGCLRPRNCNNQQWRHTPEYRLWNSIKTRCYNKKQAAYPHYGGRGIVVCDRWKASFEDFLVDVGCRPGPEYSLDRIKNDLGYEPGNVRWATRKMQNRNKRNNHWIEYNGETLIIADWKKKAGIGPKELRDILENGRRISSDSSASA